MKPRPKKKLARRGLGTRLVWHWKRSIIYNRVPIGSILDSNDGGQGGSQGSDQMTVSPTTLVGPTTQVVSSGSASLGVDVLCCPILAFVKASRLKLDAAAIKKLLVDGFSAVDLSEAMKRLWDSTQTKLTSLDFVYHTRRDTEKRPANIVVCEDLLLAFDKLDSASSIPPIYCEADQLLRIPPISTDGAASLLSDTSSLVDKLNTDVSGITASLISNRDRMNELEKHIMASCAEMRENLSTSITSLSSEISAVKERVSRPSTVSNTNVAPQSAYTVGEKRRSDGVDRSANVIFFGLPEGSLISTRELVDEISTFLTGSLVGVKDMLRIGKRIDGRCRPTLVKLGTVWDKRLLLASKTKLKSFRQRGIFVRQDMSKDERLAATTKRSNSQSHPSSRDPPRNTAPPNPQSCTPIPFQQSSTVLFGSENQD